jgi:hypothetical protein
MARPALIPTKLPSDHQINDGGKVPAPEDHHVDQRRIQRPHEGDDPEQDQADLDQPGEAPAKHSGHA